mgnify:CR=1 FL=1
MEDFNYEYLAHEDKLTIVKAQLTELESAHFSLMMIEPSRITDPQAYGQWTQQKMIVEKQINLFKEYIAMYKEYNILDIFIEEPLIASNNQYTSNLLMKFNGICSYMLYTDLLVLPKHKSVHEIRKILFKF